MAAHSTDKSITSRHTFSSRSFANCAQVQQCYYVAGEWDFVLLLVEDEKQG